jgi:hypothetical protein
MKRRSMIRIAALTAILLSVPLVAMRFTDEVNWSLSDFAIGAVLLLGAGIVYEFLARRNSAVGYRAAVGVAVGSALLLVWATLAVGLG